jgi:RNA polymerase sigma-70 factor (ECF subfamily)
MTDQDLIAFCRVQYPRLAGLLGLYCGDRGVGEELAQETLARVWRKWPRVHHLDRPEAWAERVGINLANSHFRRILAERAARRRMGPPQQTRELSSEDALSLRRDISNLPRRQREAVVLHYYLDLELVEVADRMGSSVPAVKSLLHRAIKRLRAENQKGELSEVSDVT